MKARSNGHVRELHVRDLLNKAIETTDKREDRSSRISLRMMDVDEDEDSGYCESRHEPQALRGREQHQAVPRVR